MAAMASASLQLKLLMKSPSGTGRKHACNSTSTSTSAPLRCNTIFQGSSFLDSPSRLLLSRQLCCNSSSRLANANKSRILITCQAKSEDVDSIGALGTGAIAGGLVANPVVIWSLYTLKTTGCGLPPGPAGSLGAIEGVSYLVILGVIAWSIYTKVKSGSGLPSGPFGLLGAVEGFSYLSLLAIAVVFGLQILEVGSIPGPLPGDQCSG